ncbi:hypothetical protein PHYBOEH_000985 [Phytophthora boehmeriae]|uniref:RxLR effector protein n=1 Tax=Phytophthora boehmeriae TaxID=109152 RepID=A0A8T1V8C6_9STRA|nr:hypothetical protein PHYBOEH_000985 [Phytophthora boehmeriae]
MRLTNFLLVATATLLASCEAVSPATGSTQTKFSMMASTEAVQVKDAVAGVKRFLRSINMEDYDEDDDDKDDDGGEDEAEDEERGLLDGYISRHGQAWVDKWVARANERAEAGSPQAT